MTDYIVATIFLLIALGFVFIYFNQRLLLIFLLITASLLSIMLYPKTLKELKREWARLLQEAEISAPLRMGDFFTKKGMLKLVSRWGVWKTIFLYNLLDVLIIGGVLFILSLWDMISITAVVIATIAFYVGSVVIFSLELRIARIP